MKIYTNTFSLKTPTPKTIKIVPYSNYKIGVKIEDGVEGSSVQLFKDNVQQSADDETVNGFTTFTQNSQGSDIEYVVKYVVSGSVKAEFKLVCVMANSTVYNVDVSGSNYTAGDGITLSANEFSVNNTIMRKTVEGKTFTGIAQLSGTYTDETQFSFYVISAV